MTRHTIHMVGLVLMMSCACTELQAPPTDAVMYYHGYHSHTLVFGQQDNAEVVSLVPGTNSLLLVSSKARKLTLLEVVGEQLHARQTASLFIDDVGESELTHIAVSADGSWGVVTRTLIEKDAQERTTDCNGELVFVALEQGRFGEIITRVPVGPMPDAVAISPTQKLVASANERDSVWGKCAEVQGLQPPSISIIDLSAGLQQAKELVRVEMVGPHAEMREPESVTFSTDGAHLVTTLQDAHEVGILPVKDALEAAPNATSELMQIRRLPQNALGQDPWPDGITRFRDHSNTQDYFAIAGEANDTISIIDLQGTLVGSYEITGRQIPAEFPRDGSWGPLFRPDSITSFVWQERPYLAFTLKGSGAVGLLDVYEAQTPRWSSIIKVGRADETMEEESRIGPEGIAASDQHGFIVTANEMESSVSLIVP